MITILVGNEDETNITDKENGRDIFFRCSGVEKHRLVWFVGY